MVEQTESEIDIHNLADQLAFDLLPDDNDTSRAIKGNEKEPVNIFFDDGKSINSYTYTYNDNLLTLGKDSESTLYASTIEINSSDEFVINPDSISPLEQKAYGLRN